MATPQLVRDIGVQPPDDSVADSLQSTTTSGP
jgi:hypothetical protein